MKNKQIIVASVVCATLLSGCGVTPRETPVQSADETTVQSTVKTAESTPTIESSSATKSEEESSSEENSVEQNFKIGETITTQKWEITVDSVNATEEIKEDYGGFKADEGNKYVVVNVSVKNIGKEADTFLPSFGLSDDIHAKIMYEDYEFSGTNLLGSDNDIHDAYINPLSTKSGIMAFSLASEIADKTNELSLVISEGDNTYRVSFSE